MLSLFLLSMAASGILLYFMRDSSDTERALSYYKAVMPVFVLQGVAFLHFSFVHTRVTRRKLLLPGAYLLFFVTIALSFGDTGLLVEGMDEDPYGYFPVTGPLFFLVPLCGYLFCVGGLVNYIMGCRVALSHEVRNSYLYIIAGVCSFLLGGVFDLFSVFGAPIPPVALVGSIIFCLLVSIAILKYHLLEIHVVLRRGTAYLLMSALVALPYVGIIMIAYHLLGDTPPWVYVVVVLPLAFGLLPLWGRVQRLVDRWFYRERYDHLRALAQFSQEAHGISDLDKLGSSLVRLIGKALQTSGVYLLLPSVSGEFSVISSSGNGGCQLTLEGHSPVLQWLGLKEGLLRGRDLDIYPQLQGMSGKEREELTEIKAQLFVPLKTKENELVGVLILGSKPSGQPYSQEDERLVYAVASRMAMELENARLYNMEKVARKELQEQNEQKTEFLHSIAHELKTPLTAIISSSELLQGDGVAVKLEQRQQMLRNISKGGWRMDKRISELLDFARMQTGALELQMQSQEIGPVLREVASQLRILFTNRGQSLAVEIPDSLPIVNVDKAKIEQVLINLLENANKFSPHGSSITLRASEVDARVVVKVEDSAPVVTEEERGRIFNPYYRGEDAGRRRRLPGIGLGLAISKQLVEAQHGEIWAEVRPGEGNTFAFSLPASSIHRGESGGDNSFAETGG